ncbi:MAG: TetR/AcrR family transcriptional regulator [Burkholderiaceae bacterium]|jgi:AcrR family transcriptional regulator
MLPVIAQVKIRFTCNSKVKVMTKRNSELTQSRLLDAAEIVFGEFGYSASNLRQIATRAKVTPAMIKYYFKNKDGLYLSVFARRAVPIMNERESLLADYMKEHAPKAIPVEKIVHAFIFPPLSACKREKGAKWFIKLTARLHHEPVKLRRKIRQQFYNQTTQKFLQALRLALPKESNSSLCWFLTFIMGIYTYVLSTPDRIEFLSEGKIKGEDYEKALPEIVRFCTRGFGCSDRF